MKAVIAQFYNTEKAALKQALKKCEMWNGRLAWYVVQAKNGYFVISETVARRCYSDYKFSYRDRKL